MSSGDGLDYTQAEPAAFATVRGIHAIETLEDPWNLVRRDARTGIAYGQFGRAIMTV